MFKKTFVATIASFLLLGTITASAATIPYTVLPGDTMWKIAQKYQIGVSEIISSNPQVSNPERIYPGQKLNIPDISTIKSMEYQVVKLVNVQRSQNGLPLLTHNWQLSRVARYKSQDFIAKNYFDHTSPTYGSPFTMMQNFGLSFSAAGENIAFGQRTPEEVMNAWMNSPGHRANILSRVYSDIGVGLAKDSAGRCYWTQMFIKK